MSRRSCASRLPLLLATAIVAAALGDPFVETIANSGVVGRGYADHNHVSVVPALLAGVCLLFIIIAMRCAQLLRRARRLKRLPVRASLSDAACVFVLQLGALFVMESVERMAYGGSVSLRTGWLGGPVWFSLLVHASLAYACTLAAARFTRSAAHRCAALLAVVLRPVITECGAVLTSRRNDAALLPAQRFCVRHVAERAPPVLPAPICAI